MKYHQTYAVCNDAFPFVQPDTRHRRKSSLACRLLVHRFGLTPATAITIARVAGYPAAMEE